MRTKALIKLLDDPDPGVFEAVEKELLQESSSVIPELETVWELTRHEICQSRIENLIHKILFRENSRRLRSWSRQATPDLLEGFILASRYHYPDLNEDKIFRQIEEIRKKVWVELNNSLTSLERSPSSTTYFSMNSISLPFPRKGGASLLHQHASGNRTGNAVSLTLLYNIIAQKLGLPVKYVDLPGNPLLAYVDRRIAAKVHPPGVNTDILFYINPASHGSITGRKELEYYLRKMNYEPGFSGLETSSPRSFLVRLLEITELSYEKNGEAERSADILEMKNILSEKKQKPFP